MSDYIDEIAPFTSDDWERMRRIVLRNRISHLGLNPAPIEAAAQFQESMLKLQEPLSLPENRTEETQQALLRWLGLTTQTDVQRIGTQIDESGVEHEAWQYTMTPLPASPKQWGEADPFFDNPRANCALARMGRRSVKQHKVEERTRKRHKRQRRAAQRRHNRGLR